MDEQLRKTFADNLKFALRMHQRTQKELADYLKVSTATVSGWVNGNKIPRADKLQSISNWLNTDLEGLLYPRTVSGHDEPVLYSVVTSPAYSEKMNELLRYANDLSEDDLTVLTAQAKRLYTYAKKVEEMRNETDSNIPESIE